MGESILRRFASDADDNWSSSPVSMESSSFAIGAVGVAPVGASRASSELSALGVSRRGVRCRVLGVSGGQGGCRGVLVYGKEG